MEGRADLKNVKEGESVRLSYDTVYLMYLLGTKELQRGILQLIYLVLRASLLG